MSCTVYETYVDDNIIYCLFRFLLFPIGIIASSVIHGKYTENIKHYHLAVPHKATPEGDFSTFHLPHFHDYDAKEFMKRRKRDAKDPDAVHYGLYVDNQLHHVELWPNRDFLHPEAVFERRDPTLPVHERDVHGVKNKKMCYYVGKVRDVDNSKAALSTCDGLTGYIHLGNKMYFIEPVHEHSPNAEGHHLHVVYTPDAEPAKGFCGVKNSEKNWEKAIKNRIREDYLSGKNPFKRESHYEVVPQWMELMVVCDKKMVLKHKGKRDIEQWVLTIFSVVRSYYSDESMTGVLTPVVVRIVYLEKEEAEIDLNILQNCYTTLANFCKWAAKLQPKDETHPNHFDVAVLLSDWDFCDKGGDCDTQGLAYTGGACTKQQNCQLNEDKGMVTSVIVSHEQGHLLGMEHDGVPPVPCPANDSTDHSYYVMSPVGRLYTIRWSPCSTASMRQLNEAHLLDCFNDEPTGGFPLGDSLPGVLYDLDEQCNMMFRDVNTSFGACGKEGPLNCAKIGCVTDEGCFFYNRDMADGTPCGPNMWCFRQKCIEKGTKPAAIDGGWGEWGDWSACSKTCGRGAQSRERLCDNPKPENRGSYCRGVSKEYRLCNTHECPTNSESFRDKQCKELFPKSATVISGKYKVEDLVGASFDTEKPCSLQCELVGDRVKNVAKVIADGAKCEIGNRMKMCIGGRCVEVACDGKFENSEAVEDQCGICNGDGTMCTLIEGSDKTPSSGYRMVAVVPSGAKKIKFEEVEPNSNHLALGRPDNKTVTFNQDYRFYTPDVYPIGTNHRTFFLYSSVLAPSAEEPKRDIETMIWDWNKEDIGLYIAHMSPDYRGLVKWSWIEPTDSPTREAKYRWEIAEYKECSANCGGGVQEPNIVCYEELGGKVSDSYCSKLEIPAEEPKKCNEKPCESVWKVGRWGRCRACKTKGGVRVREVQCMRKNPKKEEDDILVEDSECKEPKPGTVELCETYKKCGTRGRRSSYVPAKFQETVWRQMNKLHLTKRGAPNPKVYLKGKAPTTSKCTKPFTWTPPPLKSGTHISIDRELPEQMGSAVKVEMKTVTVNETGGENNMARPNERSMAVPGTTVIVKAKPFHKRNNTSEEKGKKPTTTCKPKNRAEA